ncbi:uncharacterized protein LOC125511465 [Triticum urartu]|uniref:SWIM-type domain-containing protein n=1 Tax=Triticum urartu TaxID=4572 RepID=A0A8R7QIE4_TRIUA|nr:uncharacterized protein LOC125511465 [Triticum urartu]
MDPCDKLHVRFHFGGQFVRIGPTLDYVGGDEASSEIERDRLSLPEIKGFLGDHIPVKESMKIHFLMPGKKLVDGLLFLCDDAGCMKMSEYITDGGVAEVYVEYFGEQDDQSASDSGSDFENEMDNDLEGETDVEPDAVITADDDVQIISVDPSSLTAIENVLEPNESAVITQVISSPTNHNFCRKQRTESSQVQISSSQFQIQSSQVQIYSSQVINPVIDSGNAAAQQTQEHDNDDNGSAVSDSEEDDSDYVAGSDDSGLEEEYVELREQAKAFKKRIRDSKRWAQRNPSGVVPIDLVANVEEVVGEDHFDSDDEDYSYDEESDHEGEFVRRKTKFPRYNPKVDIPLFCLGMVFRSKEQMRKALIKYGLLTFRSINFMKSEEGRIRAKCGWPGCPWTIYGAYSSRCSRFQVITYEDQHECAPNRDNHLVTAKVIARRYEHIFRANPTWKIDSIKATVLKDFFADVSTSKCKAAKKIVSEKLLAGLKDEYTKVFDYQLELLRSNPGSTILVGLNPEYMDQNIFQSFYVCFNAMKKGFKACRRVIGLDGCFFKGACQGELLCAIGRDANNQMYPVAWAVVEKETSESWEWFVGLLIKDLDINDQGEGWVFISDQQKGLINAMRNYVPKAQHGMCVRHIYANWKKKFREHALQKKFWAIAKAANREDFMYRKAKLAQDTPEGARDIMRTEPKHWARAFFPVGSLCDSVDNNLCESFNNAIVEARFYPIISMLEKIRHKMTLRVQENRSKSEKWTSSDICPNIFKKLKVAIKMTQFYDVLWNGKEGFEVKHVSGRGRSYTVNLDKWTCSCGYFQLAGMPCCHAISAIYKSGRNIADFIHKCYSVEQFKKIYEHCLEPVEGQERWPISDKPRPQAPGYVSMPGRPRNNDRKREEGEAPKGKKMSKHGTKITCSMCGHKGHNKTGCHKNPEKGKKKNAFLKKTGRKMKSSEQANTDAQIRSSQQAKSIGEVQAQAGSNGGKRKATKKQNVQSKKKIKDVI